MTLPPLIKPDRAQEAHRPRSVKHRRWITKTYHCCVPGCMRMPIEAAHIRVGTCGGTGLKPGDQWVVSLCREHHAEQHRLGEVEFDDRYNINCRNLAEEFARKSRVAEIRKWAGKVGPDG